MPIWTIARSLAPSPQARAGLERRVRDLDASLRAVNNDVAMAKVAELLLSFGGHQLSESGAKARARGYMTALDDLPAWAIAEACRRWLRKDAGEQNYNFAPSPPILRGLAEGVVLLAKHQRDLLARLLAAEVVDDPTEHDDGYCADMRARMLRFVEPFAERGGARPAERAP
jgi:hypothetical protein